MLIMIAFSNMSMASTNTMNYFKTSKYKIYEEDNKILANLDAKDVTAETILSNMSLNLYNSAFKIKAYNQKGEELTGSAKMGTGCTLKVVQQWDYVLDTITLVLYGDINGDGNITASDALAIVKNKTGKVKIPNEYGIEAGRITKVTRDKDAVPSSADALAIIKYRLGKTDITQSRNRTATISSYSDLYTQLGQCNTKLEFDSSASNYKEITTYYKKLQDVVAKYCTEDMSEATKALVLHDYLVTGTKLNYEEDICETNSKESNICNLGGTMNQLGFANTYTCLLGIAGIPSEIKRDRYANYGQNAINEVTIDGEIYYVSCGADSYISQVEGKNKVRRYFFLRNTEQLEDGFWEGHVQFFYTPVSDNTSTSTKYYGVEWPEYRSSLNYKNSETKLATGKTIVRTTDELEDALLQKKSYAIDVIDPYTETLKEIDEHCKNVVKKYITNDMSQAEKALVIHDYVCSNFMRSEHTAYDERGEVSNSEYDVAWGYYKDTLLSGMGDCIGVSSAFNTLCAYVGIETDMINQHQVDAAHGSGNHHWSLAKIDGQWYHVDCEGSDYYAYGDVDRTWFLKSDEEMLIKKNELRPCTSTKYDDYKWPEFKGVAYYQDKTGITEGIVPATSFWIREKEQGVVGETFSLRIRLFPYGTIDKPTYTSSNKNVATIDKDGNVSVVGVGTTTITVKVNGISKSFTLKTGVEPDDIVVKDVTLKVGQKQKMEYTVTPSNAAYEERYWRSTNEEVATVDDNGNVTAVGPGTARIRMYYSYVIDNVKHTTSSQGGTVTVTK